MSGLSVLLQKQTTAELTELSSMVAHAGYAGTRSLLTEAD